MYRNIIFLIAATLSNCYIFSQQRRLPPPSIPKAPPLIKSQDKYFPSQIIDPVTGKIFESNYPDTKGFPFFTEDWKYTLIKLTDGRTFDMIKTRLNLYTKELYFKTDKDVVMLFAAGYVKEIDIYDSSATKNIIDKFQTGFPDIDNQDQNTYYQVISQGNIILLKLIRKQIVVNKNDLSGEVEKQFEAYEDYYTFINGQIKRLKKDKDYVLDLLSDKKDRTEAFVKENKLSYKNVNDIKKIFDFYNSLSAPVI